jgi:hypothetical protein
VAEHLLEEVLEVLALGRGARTLRRARGICRLDCRHALVELLEMLADLDPELVQRRADPRWIEQLREARGVAIEIRA